MQDPIEKFENSKLLTEGLFGQLRNALTNMNKSFTQTATQKKTPLQHTLQDPAHQKFINKYSDPLVFQILDPVTNKPDKKVRTADEVWDEVKNGTLSWTSMIRPYNQGKKMPWRAAKDWNPFKKKLQNQAVENPEPEDKIYTIKHNGIVEKMDAYALASALKMGKFDKNKLQIWYPEIKSGSGKPHYVYFSQDHPDRDMLLNLSATI